jgi:transposase-like protein
MAKVTSLNLVKIMRRFSDADTAREYLEKMRWASGVICPHCSGCESYKLTPKATSKAPCRKGLYKCKACRKQFTVTVGTIFEDSHIPLDKWLVAIYLMCSSKKGISAHQLHRMLNLSYKAAWFMCHRIRYAMAQPVMQAKMSGIIEADETYIGGKIRGKGRGMHVGDKAPVVSLVQRGGRVRSFHMQRVTSWNLRRVLRENVEPSARLITDEHPGYLVAGSDYAAHDSVKHREHEYTRGDVTTNTVEGFFGILKRGINGVYHHVGKNHLHRYLAEFDFRYNARKTDDGTRTNMAIIGFEGKRLMYKD